MRATNFWALSSFLIATSVGLGFFHSLGTPTRADAPDINQTKVDSDQKLSRGARRKPISAADKKEIIALFKDVDPSKYRLEFNHGRETYGNKKVEMSDLEQVRKVTNPGEAVGWVVLIVEDDGVMYILAATHGQSQLEDVLGKEKTARLNHITAKYAR